MVNIRVAALLAVATFSLSVQAGQSVLLDFASPHCGPCRQMEPVVHRLIEAGYPVRQVDVTREPMLAQQFQVTRVPCFVMIVDGQEVDRVIGGTSGGRLEQMLALAGRAAAQQPEPRIRTQSPDPTPPGVFWTGMSDSPAAQNQPPGRIPSAIPRQTGTDELLLSSVRIRVEEPGGHSYGSGTIIDARSGEALVVTCGHLFRESAGKRPVTVELLQNTPEGVRVVGQVSGQVISYDLDRDIGLVSIRPDRPVRTAPIGPPGTTIDRGDRVTTVGCDHGQDPTAVATRVTAIDKYQGPHNVEVEGAPVEGRSGGGLFNDRGELIGVCFAADYEGNEGLYSGLDSIHAELDRIGMSEIYQTAKPAAPNDATLAANPPTAVGPIVRGQDAVQPLVPMPDRSRVIPTSAVEPAPLTAAAATPSNLAPVEQAAWEEIMARASTSEVICIIRPQEPGGKSEVITLSGVSPEFVRALASRRNQGQAAIVR